MAVGKMYIPHPTSLDLLLAISYRNHQKGLAYISHLAPIVFCSFLLKGKVKGGGAWHNAPLLNTLLPRSLRLGACARIISSFTGGQHVYKRRFGYCVLC